MQVLQEQSEGRALLVVRGRLHSFNVRQLRRAFEQVRPDAGGAVILDLSRLRSIDSSGIGEILFWHRHFGRRHQQLILDCPPPVMRQAIADCRLICTTPVP